MHIEFKPGKEMFEYYESKEDAARRAKQKKDKELKEAAKTDAKKK